MPVTRRYDGPECPDCGHGGFMFRIGDDEDGRFQARECFECGARWTWRPKPEEQKRRPGTAFAVPSKGAV